MPSFMQFLPVVYPVGMTDFRPFITQKIIVKILPAGIPGLVEFRVHQKTAAITFHLKVGNLPQTNFNKSYYQYQLFCIHFVQSCGQW